MSSTSADRAEQEKRGRPHVLEQRRRPRRGGQRPALVFLELTAMALIGPPRERGELGVGGGDRGTGSKPGHDRELPAVAGHGVGIPAPRQPEVGTDQEKAGRHHAHDRGGLAADTDAAPDDPGIAAKAGVPEPVADDRHRRPTGRELFTRESASELRRHADHGEQIVEQQCREDALRNVATGDVAVPQIERRGRPEGAQALDVRVLGRRQHLDVASVVRDSRKPDADGDEAIGIGVREGVQHEALHQAVDQAVGADRQAEREDCRPPRIRAAARTAASAYEMS